MCFYAVYDAKNKCYTNEGVLELRTKYEGKLIPAWKIILAEHEICGKTVRNRSLYYIHCEWKVGVVEADILHRDKEYECFLKKCGMLSHGIHSYTSLDKARSDYKSLSKLHRLRKAKIIKVWIHPNDLIAYNPQEKTYISKRVTLKTLQEISPNKKGEEK